MSDNALIQTLGIRNKDGVPMVNSRDVAAQFEKRHDHVLRDIESLRTHAPNLGDGGSPWFFEVRNPHPVIPSRFDLSFDMTRDGFTILVNRWTGEKALRFQIAYIQAFNRMEEELRNRPPVAAFDPNDPATLRNLLIDYTGRVLALQQENAELAPKAEALDRISAKDGESSLQQASKEILGKANAIFPILRDVKWIFKRDVWHPYQDKKDRGLLTVREVECRDGQSRPQTLITPKGRTTVAESLARVRKQLSEVVDPLYELRVRFTEESIAILRQAGFI